MTNRGLISVIVPVYNVEEYLERCINSIVNQTYSNIEIIIVDDGSEDQSSIICDSLAEKDERIRVIHKENGGVSSARNVGLKIARGDWLSFVDSDDWIHPQYYEIMKMISEKSSSEVIAVNHLYVTEEKSINELLHKNDEYRIISGNEIFSDWSNRFYVTGKMYAKSIINGFTFDESVHYGEDSLFNIAVLGQTDISVAYTIEKLYYYFSRKGSSVSEFRQSKRVQLCFVYLKYAAAEEKEYLKKVYLSSAIKRALSTRYEAGINSETKEIIGECNNCLKKAVKEFGALKISTQKEYYRYVLLFRLPCVYRLWRIIDDPTLLEMEKRQRKARYKKYELQ